MYNPLLVTFLAVADCGSFTKAAEKLFISPTAVMKQMNALENHMKLKLTERTPAGIRLTKAGAVIYRDTKFIMWTIRTNRSPRRERLWLITIECWSEVHPGLVTVPVNWEYSIPYGLLYSLNADGDVLRLVH